MLVFKHNPGSVSVVWALGSRRPQVVEAVLGESLTASVPTLEFSFTSERRKASLLSCGGVT
ncbi:unnamed protein product [Brassica oleracea]